MEKECTSSDGGMDTKVYSKQYFPDKLQPTELDVYLANGWFRSQNRVYTCTHIKYDVFWKVDRVWWLRFPIHKIATHRSHEKIKSKNSSFDVQIHTLEAISDEIEVLFLKYISSQSFMISKTVVELLWKDLKTPRITDSKILTVRDGDRLIGVSVFDVGYSSGMAILNFYDPDYARNSLGKYMMLISVDYLKANCYTYYYPGYIVVDRPKLNYKLFLGKEVAEYFHPDSESWVTYDETILIPEKYSSDTMDMIYNVVFRIWN